MAAASASPQLQLVTCAIVLLALFITIATSADIFLDWQVTFDFNVKPASTDQPVVTINGMFPGPLINASTNDNIHVNVFNDLDEPLLFTWNGIEQRLNSWQDGVSGTNCPIQPGSNWTYVFETKDQIGTFFYFPSVNFLKAGGGFGPIRVNNLPMISVPFPKPEAEFDLLIGDWYNSSYKDIRSRLNTSDVISPNWMLINGKGPYLNPLSKSYETFNVTQGKKSTSKTYLLRISNVGTFWSFNFRIQNHHMVLVETEGSYVNQIKLKSLDVHVGQSYSVLITANQNSADYYIVASPKISHAANLSTLVGVAVLHYDNSTIQANGSLPSGPDPFDLQFSIKQAKSIRWNLTTGAAGRNPQGTFNVTNVTISETFILQASTVTIHNLSRYAVNNVSYLTPDTPLKLADYFVNGSGVYQLDAFPINSSNVDAVRGVFVESAIHKGWTEIVLKNTLDTIDSWHLDGYSFFVVGLGEGEWKPESRSTYNLYDPVARSTVQVLPGGWSAVYVYPDNPGMWNLRSQNLKNWYLGEELYVRVHDPDPNPSKERPPPQNLPLCGKFQPPPPAPAPSPPPPNAPSPSSRAYAPHRARSLIAVITTAINICFLYMGLH